MNTNSNTYIFIYASVLVIVFAAILSVAAISLQPAQDRNIEIEKKQNILSSVNIQSTAKNAEELYKQYITESYIVNSNGDKIEGNAFTVDLHLEISKPIAERRLPVFVAENQGQRNLVIPVRGKGLWGPIWGYISFKDDYNTITGAYFDHKGETPGLGAEISTPAFQQPFQNKQIFDQRGKFVSVEVVKGGATPGNPHQVDAISGGTITSKGLEAMVKDCLSNYENYFKKQKNN